MKKSDVVLVTGASGFTGRWVVKALEQVGFTPFPISVQNPDATSPSPDLRDLASLTATVEAVRPQAVIHLAAVSFVAHGTPQDFWDINVEGSRNLLRSLHETGCEPEIIIMASSANVYGNSDASVLSEEQPTKPENAYAESKLAMEKVAAEWMDTLPIALTRPFNYTGLGQAPHFLVPKIVQHYKTRSQKIELGNIDVARDFSDVRDVAKIYVQLLTSEPEGQVVNICSGVSHTLKNVLDICSELTGHNLQIEINPDFVRANEVKSLCGDTKRLETLIGKTSRHPLKTTLHWMLNAK